MIINDIHLNEINSPNQTIRARVEIHKGSTLEKICTCGDILSEFTVERAGEGKFFGYGICQRLKVDLVDINRDLVITKDNHLEAAFGVDGNFIYPFPKFHVVETERDETNNLLSITAYDLLYEAENHTVSELILPESYNLLYFASAIAALLNISLRFENITDINAFLTNFEGGANFDGTENIRHALDAVAEATQTIYYINKDWDLTFRRIEKGGDAAITIDKNHYITLDNSGPAILSKLVHVTELGDNVEPATATEGVIQYVRDNPFWELREDVGTLVDTAQAMVEGISINQFECEWVGNYLLEIGDKIALIAEDNSTINTYVLDDSITFNGTLSQHTKWQYDKNDNETAANPSSLGEVLNQTFARVDKINQEIELRVKTEDLKTKLILTEDNISTSVQKVEKSTKEQIDALNKEVTEIKTEVSNFKIESDQALLEFQTKVEENGVTKIDTGTGYLFNEDGLTISKTNSLLSTTITDNGMSISKKNEVVLNVDDQGVKAENLHATTYLIIGNYSQIEDYSKDSEQRTACFWIGGI